MISDMYLKMQMSHQNPYQIQHSNSHPAKAVTTVNIKPGTFKEKK
jgi:hypothetical protein